MKPERFGLNFGVFSQPIRAQLRAQNLDITDRDARYFQREAAAINLLRIHSILSDSEAHRANQRLIKQIGKKAERISP